MNKSFIDPRYGTAQKVDVQFERYLSNNRICIRLVADWEPWATASTNLPHVDMPNDAVALKTYSENVGLLDLLVANGIIESAPLFIADRAFPVHRLTPEALAMANESSEVAA